MTETVLDSTDIDWFSQGKEDAWLKRAKHPPIDPEAASMYDLGYNEGTINSPWKAQYQARAAPANLGTPEIQTSNQ